MNKKLFSTLLIGGLLFSNTIIASASTQTVYNTPTRMIDNSKINIKSTIRQVLPGNEHLLKNAKAPTNTSTLDVSSGIPGWGTHDAVAISKSTHMEDYISAKVRMYNRASTLVGHGFDELTKATKISASASTEASAYEAYGNHTYKLSGYKDVYHETYDNF